MSVALVVCASIMVVFMAVVPPILVVLVVATTPVELFKVEAVVRVVVVLGVVRATVVQFVVGQLLGEAVK